MGLGFGKDGISSTALDISADGQVVVGYRDNALAGQQAFRWTREEGMMGLGPMPSGSIGGEANAVSADGSVIAGFCYNPGYYQSFGWTDNQGMVGFNYYPEWRQNLSYGVSGDGSVVVGYGWRQLFGPSEAYRWTNAEGMVGLGLLPNLQYGSRALGTSADGRIVVGYGFNASNDTEAFRWTQAHGMQGLGHMPGGGRSVATAASSDGSVVVGTDSGLTIGQRAFRWSLFDGLVDIGAMPGGSQSSASDVSSDGLSIVGWGNDTQGAQQAFLWEPGEGMRSLRSVLEGEFGLDLGGWALREAKAISADGHTIVGLGNNPLGQQEAWIAVIPESGVSTLLAPLLVLTGRRPRVRISKCDV